MPLVTVFSTRISPRLRYILDWLLKEVLHFDYRITTSEEDVKELQNFISYGKYFPQAVFIPDGGLLWEKGIREQKLETGIWENIPVLYPDSRGGIPFDLFSSLFFLITRYEEYYPYTPDKHGRFPPGSALLFRKGWMERPLVDEWIFAFYSLLKEKDFQPALDAFAFFPTYDIDMAFSFKYKGRKRNFGALSKDLLNGNLDIAKQRIAVLSGQEKDPFDCFSWLRETHKTYNLKPLYFILCSLKTTAFDKNISPLHPEMQRLISRLSDEGKTGLHPSYFSTDPTIFLREKSTLENITGHSISHSRQHYIRLTLPETYRKLMTLGITDDWSMGFGSSLGFRAGTGRSFFWYDLENEKPTSLRVHPFCFMDSTAHFDEKLSVQDAFERLEKMTVLLRRCSSRLTTVFHNFSLGTDASWKGWGAAYSGFLKSLG